MTAAAAAAAAQAMGPLPVGAPLGESRAGRHDGSGGQATRTHSYLPARVS
jgi:hypothetical protein